MLISILWKAISMVLCLWHYMRGHSWIVCIQTMSEDISDLLLFPLGFLADSPFLDDLDHIVSCFDKTTKLRFRDSKDHQYVKFGSTRDNDEVYNIRFGQLKLQGSVIESKMFVICRHWTFLTDPMSQCSLSHRLIASWKRCSIREGLPISPYPLVSIFSRDALPMPKNEPSISSLSVVLRPAIGCIIMFNPNSRSKGWALFVPTIMCKSGSPWFSVRRLTDIFCQE